MLRRFLPRETSFFDFFERHAALIIRACQEMLEIASDSSKLPEHVARIKELEREADAITHQCGDELGKTFITPIERTSIHDLIKRMDDVIDSIDAAVSRMELYELHTTSAEFRAFAEVLLQAGKEIEGAVRGLRDLKNPKQIEQHCIAIHGLENRADEILRTALVRLFRDETNPIFVIKCKEIYERLEKATDRCEAVANIIQGVVIEAS
jgi:uncharacterized protein Yka (UPF0111/DUF47 family)